MTTSIPITLDFASIIMFVLASLLGLVWQSLRTQFRMTLDQVEARCLANDTAMRERISRLEEEVNNLPQKIDGIILKLNAIELMLATQYATKVELRDASSTRQEIIDALQSLQLSKGKANVR